MNYCSRCGKIVENLATQCPGCGARLVGSRPMTDQDRKRFEKKRLDNTAAKLEMRIKRAKERKELKKRIKEGEKQQKLQAKKNKGLTRRFEKYLSKGKTLELIDILRIEEDRDIRMYAVRALEKIGDKRAVEPLVEALKNEKNGDLRASVACALGSIGDPRAVESLIAVLTDESHGGNRFLTYGGNRFLTDKVLSALGKIKDKRAIAPLIELRIHSRSGTLDGINGFSIDMALGDITGLGPYQSLEAYRKWLDG